MTAYVGAICGRSLIAWLPISVVRMAGAASTAPSVDYTQIRIGAVLLEYCIETNSRMRGSVAAVHDFDFHRADIACVPKDLQFTAASVLKAAF